MFPFARKQHEVIFIMLLSYLKEEPSFSNYEQHNELPTLSWETLFLSSTERRFGVNLMGLWNKTFSKPTFKMRQDLRLRISHIKL